MNLDVVIPAIARDRARLELFLASWRCNWKVPGKLFLFVRDDEMHLFEGLASDPRIEVRTKRSLIGDAAYAPGANGGWYRQQMVKLAAHEVVQGPFYCCLDADFLVAQPVYLQDLIANGKGFAYVLPDALRIEGYRKNYEVVGGMLGVAPVVRDILHACPPFVFRKDIVAACLSRLGAWQEVLASVKGWTEVSLYRTTAEILGEWETSADPSYDRIALDVLGHGDPRTFIAWDPVESLSQYKLVSVSGASGIPARLTKQKLVDAGVAWAKT